MLDEYGLEPEDGALIVSREIAGSGGRGGARVNGRSVPLSVLQELGERLVDVHGQSAAHGVAARRASSSTTWIASPAPSPSAPRSAELVPRAARDARDAPAS